MKKTIFIIVIQLIFTNITFSQSSYTYEKFNLNSVVTYDDIYNYYYGTIETITEKDNYHIGDEIEIEQKSLSLLGNSLNFIFFENTQILHCVFIAFCDNYRITNGKTAWANAKSQLGIPTRGYEIIETSNNPTYKIDTKKIYFKGRYEYCYNGYEILIDCSIATVYPKNYILKSEFNVCFHKSSCGSFTYPRSGKVVDTDVTVEYITKY